MAKYSGITSQTYNDLIVDAGEVRLNYVSGATPGTLLGATRGGSKFSVETEYREMPADGAKGPVKGSRRITKVNAKMTVSIVQFNKELFQMALPGSALTTWPATTPTHDEIKRALQLALTDYKDSVVLLGEVSGSNLPVICGLKNVLATGNFELSTSESDESVIAIEFTAHFDPADLDAEPWFIRYPSDTDAA